MKFLALLLALALPLQAARNFNGTSDRIDFATTPTRTAFSFSAWVRTTSSSTSANWYVMCVHITGNTNVGALLRLGASRRLEFGTVFASDPNTLSIRATQATLSTNTLYHVAVIYDGGNASGIRMFINGVEGAYTSTSADTTLGAWGGTLSVGGRIFDDTRNWPGYIDLPAAWNIQLTEADVAALAAGAHPAMIRPEALIFASDLGATVREDIAGGTVTSDGTTLAEHVRHYRAAR